MKSLSPSFCLKYHAPLVAVHERTTVCPWNEVWWVQKSYRREHILRNIVPSFPLMGFCSFPSQHKTIALFLLLLFIKNIDLLQKKKKGPLKYLVVIESNGARPWLHEVRNLEILSPATSSPFPLFVPLCPTYPPQVYNLKQFPPKEITCIFKSGFLKYVSKPCTWQQPHFLL